MEPIVRTALLELREKAGDAEYVFVNPDTGTRYTDVKKAFSAACRQAGITDFRFHDLRHTFGTRLADAGVDVVKIKELMGHASIVTTMRYIHATDQGKRGAITVLSEYRHGSDIVARLSQKKSGRLYSPPQVVDTCWCTRHDSNVRPPDS